MASIAKWIAPRVEELGLEKNLRELEESGYTVLTDVAPQAFTQELRSEIVRCQRETNDRSGGTGAHLLGRGEVFEQAVLVPKIHTLMECLLGQGMLMSQLIGSVRPRGAGNLGLHADNNWIPAPFPDWHIMLTACWACDDFTETGGSTKVIPGSHKHGRHPTPDEIRAEDGAVPVECPAGSVAVWNSSIWHGNYARRLEGERVVLHMTYTRLAFRPVEDYGYLDDAWLEGKPKELATLLGRDDFLEHRRIAEGFADPKKIGKVFQSVQAPDRKVY